MASLFDRLFPSTTAGRQPMAPMILRQAKLRAWKHRHAQVQVEHLAHVVLDLVEVRQLLAARGIHADDALAVVEQLLSDRPRWDPEAPETEPSLDVLAPALDRAMQAAGPVVHWNVARMVPGLAALLPPELGFVRAALLEITPELAALYDVMLSEQADTAMTLEGWTPDARQLVALAQVMVKTKWASWQVDPVHVFLTFLFSKSIWPTLRALGIEPKAITEDMAAVFPPPTWPVRDRPAELVLSLSPALYALLVRAERHAAADRSDVRLRHLLEALHAEPDLAPFVARLVT